MRKAKSGRGLGGEKKGPKDQTPKEPNDEAGKKKPIWS